MVTAWIVITLLIALVAGIIGAGFDANDGGSGLFGFVFGFALICQISLITAVLAVAVHFIGKYW